MAQNGAKWRILAPLNLWNCEAVLGASVDGAGVAPNFSQFHSFTAFFFEQAPCGSQQEGSRLGLPLLWTRGAAASTRVHRLRGEVCSLAAGAIVDGDGDVFHGWVPCGAELAAFSIVR